MNTSDPNVLKEFVSVLNRTNLTEAVYQRLLERWDLANVNLDEEMDRVNQKKSYLTKSRREALPYFLKLRAMLQEKQAAETKAVSLNATDSQSINSDTLIVQ